MPNKQQACGRWLTPALACMLVLVACGGGGGGGSTAGSTPVTVPTPVPTPAVWGTPKSSARFFISGHSLTNDPLGEDMVGIATQLGNAQSAKFNEQIVLGSPIRARISTVGGFGNLLGYGMGKSRDNVANISNVVDGLNVIQEFLSGATIGGDRYDTLVITENHNLLDMLQWESSVKMLRHYHERFIAGNTSGQTYLYQSWWEVSKSAPQPWIDKERVVSTGWHCMASRINQSLWVEGRSDRIRPLPTSAALADLVERATQGNVSGVTQGNTTATMNAIFDDDVHLTRLGIYYMALVTYSAIYQRSPEGAVPHTGVPLTQPQAQALQHMAWSFVSNFYANYTEPSLALCRSTVMPQVCTAYWTLRPTRYTPALESHCISMFGTNDINNPFYYNAAHDALHDGTGFWLPPTP